MFKKIITFTLITAVLFSFSGCGKYDVDKQLTDEQKTTYNDKLSEEMSALKELEDNSGTDAEKLEKLQIIGVIYRDLGEYKNAIKYYKKALEIKPTDYLSLNNLVAIYEEVEDLDKAVEYIDQLYNQYPADQGVVKDAVRIHVEMEDFDIATDIITTYAIYVTRKEGGATAEEQSFASETYDSVYRAQNMKLYGVAYPDPSQMEDPATALE